MLKDKFREIIERANAEHTNTVVLGEEELDAAAEQCESLAMDMMEKLAIWATDNVMGYDSINEKWYLIKNQEASSTRELIEKFLNTQK